MSYPFKYFRQMSYEDAAYTVKGYLEEIGKYQEADLAFQANKYSRWDKDQKSGYIASIIENKAPSKFIFADAEKCLEAAKERNEKSDIKYFQEKVDRNVKNINVDSNNRNLVIVDFMNNEIKLPHGKYDIGGAIVTVDSENDEWETLDDVLKDAFLNARITISVYTDATREELSDLFRNVNDGRPLNHPEILNSYTTLVANTIREVTDKHGDYFVKQGKWFSDTVINRRGMDQFISCMAFVYCYDIKKAINPNTITNFYREGSDGEQQILNFRRTFNDFMKDVMTKDAYAIANRNSVFDLFVIYCAMKNKKLKINDNWQFLESYMKAVVTLLTNGKRYEHESFKDPKSFDTMVGGKTIKTNNVLRNELIMEIFDVESLTTQLDPKRTFNTQDKMILAVRDNFVTPEGKKIIPALLHTNEYHGGHDHTPYRDGGKSQIDNGAIQEKNDNLKLGKKPIAKKKKTPIAA